MIELNLRRMHRLVILCSLCCLLLWPGAAAADNITITMNSISDDGIGESIGTIEAQDGPNGLVIRPSLQGLSEGEHGFHLHAGESCEIDRNGDGMAVAGLAALGHWDPDQTNSHQGPFGEGHRGDLSRLIVDADGVTRTDVVAPRLSSTDLRGRALIVHAGGDTYSDTPPLGGGGARIACGIAN